ncbi:hypothetical protein [Amycolatopsis jiangsuensis]|uniref:Uncharacterized protein n=1 Tax=Amycolatopsis jiangsuensis TaxID=1181879 RepID=A0A840J0F8_9PSEU|nr:hypothetical protein [Amycolatopsis jiangsuensis]MBB4687219.1 hypothetical protein [Amycolatopsis jiangsuensis]
MSKQAITKKALRGLGGSGFKAKLLVLALVAFVLWQVVTSPLESAHFVGHVWDSVVTFFKSF